MQFFTLEIDQDRTVPEGEAFAVPFTLDFTTALPVTTQPSRCVVLKLTIPAAGNDTSGGSITLQFQVTGPNDSNVPTQSVAVVQADATNPLPVSLIDSVSLLGGTAYTLALQTNATGSAGFFNSTSATDLLFVSVQGDLQEGSGSSPNGFPVQNTEINVNGSCPS